MGNHFKEESINSGADEWYIKELEKENNKLGFSEKVHGRQGEGERQERG